MDIKALNIKLRKVEGKIDKVNAKIDYLLDKLKEFNQQK